MGKLSQYVKMRNNVVVAVPDQSELGTLIPRGSMLVTFSCLCGTN